MGIDLKYLIIGGILVILLVAFGNNPVENARNAREEEKKGKDPLMESIREYNEKNSGGRASTAASTRNNYTSSGGAQSYGGSGFFGSGNNAATEYNAEPRMPGYMYPGGQTPPVSANPAAAASQASGYYPPPVPPENYPAGR